MFFALSTAIIIVGPKLIFLLPKKYMEYNNNTTHNSESQIYRK